MKRVLVLAPGLTGVSHLVVALSLKLAVDRAGFPVKITTIRSTEIFSAETERLGLESILWKVESPELLVSADFEKSTLFRLICEQTPDLLIVNKHWFVAQALAREVPCPVWFMTWQTPDRFLEGATHGLSEGFDGAAWEQTLTIEPFRIPARLKGAKQLPPFVLRNPAELLPKELAKEALGVARNDDRPVCLLTAGGYREEYQDLTKTYSYLKDEGWNMITAGAHSGGFFPIVDAFNAVDLLICSSGYSSYWEARWMAKESIFYSVPRVFENQVQRLLDAEPYEMTENGADVLAKMLAERLGL